MNKIINPAIPLTKYFLRKKSVYQFKLFLTFCESLGATVLTKVAPGHAGSLTSFVFVRCPHFAPWCTCMWWCLASSWVRVISTFVIMVSRRVDWGKPQTFSLRISGVWADIWTRDHSTTTFSRLLVNNEMGKIRKETVVRWFNLPSQLSIIGTEENRDI